MALLPEQPLWNAVSSNNWQPMATYFALIPATPALKNMAPSAVRRAGGSAAYAGVCGERRHCTAHFA